MKTKILYILFSISILFLFQNCSEDFITKKKLAEESTETFYLTQANAKQAVTTCYAVMLARGSFSRNYWVFGDCASNDSETAGEPGGSDQPPAQRIDQMVHLSSNIYFDWFWRNMYEGIFRCNQVVLKVPEAVFDEGLKNRYIAEAKFLRAMYHFYLNQVFGGVPYIDYKLSPPYEVPRNSIANVLHKVQRDMREVAETLPESYGPADIGRATSGSAKGYLLKALVYESSYAENYAGDARFDSCEVKWQEAYQVAKEIIDSKVYELDPDFARIWTVEGETSSEAVFYAKAYSSALSSSEDINQPGVGTVGNIYQSVRGYITGYDASGAPIAISRTGWGLNAPSFELYAAFDEDDPRREISFIVEGDSVLVPEGDIVKPYLADVSASPTHMNSAKYDPEPSEWIYQYKNAGPLDIKMMRYADVVLLGAEAALGAGENGDALDWVNMVRERARNSGTSSVPVDLTSVTLQDIQHERRLELALEGHRFFDLVRWGIAYENIEGTVRETDKLLTANPEPVHFVLGKNEFFPIPLFEVIQTNGVIEQNPFY